MFEIEIKARVKDRENVVKKLNEFAEYICSIIKEDVYYRFPIENKGDPVTFRIRKEKITENGVESFQNLFTYKKKELRTLSADSQDSGKNNNIEVNVEREFSLSETEPLVQMALDLGARVHMEKEKYTECWHLETECGTANIELCNVPPLGDFLEIEIVAESDDDSFVRKIRHIEEDIMTKTGISLDDVEDLSYSEMLRRVRKADK